MNNIKKILTGLTGYWFHKKSQLPVGADLFVDLQNKICYPSLDVLFDVGANIGQTRKWFRYHLNKATIYCFEPVRSTFEQLKINAKDDPNCILINEALGDKTGTKTISLFEDNMTVLNSLRDDMMNNVADARKEIILINTLDAYCNANNITKIDLLKIDTEGFEINVLEGAAKMMQSNRISFVYCESGFQNTNQRNANLSQLTEYLVTKGFYFFGLYQVDYHDWKRGNSFGNALFVHRSVFP